MLLLSRPTVSRLLSRGQAIAGVNTDDTRIAHSASARAYLDVGAGALVIGTGFDRFAHMNLQVLI